MTLIELQSDGEGQSSDNLDREDSSEEGDLDDAGSHGEQIKRQVNEINNQAIVERSAGRL